MYPDGDIAVMNAGGGDQTLLLDRTMPGDVFSDRLAAWRPDGKKISHAVDDFEQVEIWIMDSDGSDGQLLVGEVAPVTSHSWSPDGKRIAFVSPEHDISILDLSSRTITKLAEERLSDERDPDWSPDGSWIVYLSHELGAEHGTVYAVDVDGRSLVQVTADNVYHSPRWRP